LASVIKARTIGADRPKQNQPIQSIDEQIAISMRWAAVSPPMPETTEDLTDG
jgi:hypothetical protein